MSDRVRWDISQEWAYLAKKTNFRKIHPVHAREELGLGVCFVSSCVLWPYLAKRMGLGKICSVCAQEERGLGIVLAVYFAK